MHDMHFKPLSEKDRKRNEYLEKMNHAPYFTIFMIVMAMFLLFTTAVLMGVF
ncbi:hypothetical protein VB715_06375 [Crocosphaera sp. UHCC 0190]|uniref:hypothetical protein n=1 Tax=unclassified Crocosphaera TaxID=2623705 RepID=UPI002B20FDCE|nr:MULTISPECIES: hypothetical protein [unclassified Crocosphaera]MEA5509386.1 hypothetical protein [Crocosphaera sp. UHCC 0190]MEA5534635.1 hypothetical protein [Crocosphaera sp. XPORK-15E]